MSSTEFDVLVHDGVEPPRVVHMALAALDAAAEDIGIVRMPMGSPVAPVDMEGLNLVRHHLQQAQLAAQFLPGGESHGSVMEPIVEQLYLSDKDAADALREDLQAALEHLEALNP